MVVVLDLELVPKGTEFSNTHFLDLCLIGVEPSVELRSVPLASRPIRRVLSTYRFIRLWVPERNTAADTELQIRGSQVKLTVARLPSEFDLPKVTGTGIDPPLQSLLDLEFLDVIEESLDRVVAAARIEHHVLAVAIHQLSLFNHGGCRRHDCHFSNLLAPLAGVGKVLYFEVVAVPVDANLAVFLCLPEREAGSGAQEKVDNFFCGVGCHGSITSIG